MTESDLDITIWRYMPFERFLFLLTTGGLWFSKLTNQKDGLEGRIPMFTKEKMKESDLGWADILPEYLHEYLGSITDINERDGREGVVTNSWFIGEKDSIRMWQEYSSVTEGVAVKSTPRKLATSLILSDLAWMGKIKYINHAQYDMGLYKGARIIDRAFLKNYNDFKHECEFRVAVANFRTPFCLKPDGVQYSAEEVTGKGMNNLDDPGLCIMSILGVLVEEVVICPQASDGFYNRIAKLIKGKGLACKVSYSSLKI